VILPIHQACFLSLVEISGDHYDCLQEVRTYLASNQLATVWFDILTRKDANRPVYDNQPVFAVERIIRGFVAGTAILFGG